MPEIDLQASSSNTVTSIGATLAQTEDNYFYNPIYYKYPATQYYTFSEVITLNTNQEFSMKRIVNVIIADPHAAVPVDKTILKTVLMTVTDLSDEDLFYSYNLNELVTEHNKYRVTVDDTTAPRLPDGSFPKLKHIKVSELRKLVITVANL